MAVTEPNLDFRDAPDGSLVWTIVDEPALHAAKITPNIVAPSMRYVQLSQNPAGYPGGFPDSTPRTVDWAGHPAAPNSLVRTNDVTGSYQAQGGDIPFTGTNYKNDPSKPPGQQVTIINPGLYVVQYAVGSAGFGPIPPYTWSIIGMQPARCGHNPWIISTAGGADQVTCEDVIPVFPAIPSGFLVAPAAVPLVVTQRSGFNLPVAYLDLTIYRLGPVS